MIFSQLQSYSLVLALYKNDCNTNPFFLFLLVAHKVTQE